MSSPAAENTDVAMSKQIGALVGPVVLAIASSELPFVQPQLYDEQTPPVVCVLLVIGGVITVRSYRP